MAPPLDFNATLAEQLRDAGMQMRAMTKPQKQRQHDAPTQDDVQEHAPRQAYKQIQEQSHELSREQPPEQTLGQAPTSSALIAQGLTGEPPVAPTVTVTHEQVRGQAAGQGLSVTAQDATVHAEDKGKHEKSDKLLRDRHENSNANSHVQNAATQATVTEAVLHTGDNTGSATIQETAMHAAQAKGSISANAVLAGTVSTGIAPRDDASTGNVFAGTEDTVAVTVADAANAANTLGAAPVTTPVTTPATAFATELVNATTLAENLHQASDVHDSLLHSSAHSPAHSEGYFPTGGHDSAALGDDTTCDRDSDRNSVHSAELPDAAPELWAMSHHSAAPTLSERSWTGGVRGAVLDALRGLAGGQGHVLVNLKRLATHTGISYGSVRNAMSRLTRSGDILTRQIRMADGHGVRVEFLTLPGQEGTRQMPTAMHSVPATGSTVTSSQGSGSHMNSHMNWQTPYAQPSTAMNPDTDLSNTNMYDGQRAATGATVSDTAAMTAYSQHMTPQQAMPQQAPTQQAPPQQAQGTSMHYAAHSGTQGNAQRHFQGNVEYTPAMQGQQGQAQGQSQGQSQGHPGGQAVTVTDGMTAAQAVTTANPALAAFWQTDDSLFACAWPHVAAAGLGMPLLRGLAPIFAVQGFDAAVLPRCLRYLDWELENMGVRAELPEWAALPDRPDRPVRPDRPDMPHRGDRAQLSDLASDALNTPDANITLEAAHQLTHAFMRTLQRRGSWPRPALYEEGED